MSEGCLAPRVACEEAVVAVLDVTVFRNVREIFTPDSSVEYSTRIYFSEVVDFLVAAVSVARRCLYVILLFEDDCSESSRNSIFSFSVWLGGLLESEALRHEFVASPIVVPWVTRNHPPVPTSPFFPLRLTWAQGALLSVHRHFGLTSEGIVSLSPHAFPGVSMEYVALVVDPEKKFTASEAIHTWSRHLHIPFSSDEVNSPPSPGDPCYVHPSGGSFLDKYPLPSCHTELRKGFRFVMVGGTFDRLHAGHKALLTAAAFASDEKVGIAVSAGPLLQNKHSLPAGETEIADSIADLLAPVQPFAVRLRHAAAFVQLLLSQRLDPDEPVPVFGEQKAIDEEIADLVSGYQLRVTRALTISKANLPTGYPGWQDETRGSVSSGIWKRIIRPIGSPQNMEDFKKKRWTPHLSIEVFRLTDTVGPAGDIKFDCLVVSKETESGGDFINKRRIVKGLAPVEVLPVNLIYGSLDSSGEFLKKLSSTDLRFRQVRNLISALNSEDVDELRKFRSRFLDACLVLISGGKQDVAANSRTLARINWVHTGFFTESEVPSPETSGTVITSKDTVFVALESLTALYLAVDFWWQKMLASCAGSLRFFNSFSGLVSMFCDRVHNSHSPQTEVLETSFVRLGEVLYSISSTLCAKRGLGSEDCRICLSKNAEKRGDIRKAFPLFGFEVLSFARDNAEAFFDDLLVNGMYTDTQVEAKRFLLSRVLLGRHEVDLCGLPSGAGTYSGFGDGDMSDLFQSHYEWDLFRTLTKALPFIKSTAKQHHGSLLRKIISREGRSGADQLLRKEYFFISEEEFKYKLEAYRRLWSDVYTEEEGKREEPESTETSSFC